MGGAKAQVISKADKRHARLTELLARLEGGNDVAQRDLKLALTAKQFADMGKQWKQQTELRQLEKPAEIADYERYVQRVVMAFGRTEGRGTNSPTTDKKRKALARLSTAADSAFEDAITRLEEILSVDPTLQAWLDREVNFGVGAGEGVECAPENIPRVVTSRSLQKQAGVKKLLPIISKRELKKAVVQGALAELDAAAELKKLGISKTEQETAQKAKLKRLLKSL